VGSPVQGGKVLVAAIDHRGPYLAHCPDRRIRDLVEVAGEEPRAG